MRSTIATAGTPVTAKYRGPQNRHSGIILPKFHPAAWRGTFLDPTGTSTAEEISQQAPWTTNHSKDPNDKVPVAWSFGHVYWEKPKDLEVTNQLPQFQLPTYIYVSHHSPEHKILHWENHYPVHQWIEPDQLEWATTHPITGKTVHVCGIGNPCLHDLREFNRQDIRQVLEQMEKCPPLKKT
jgi:hypothetical protein